MKPAPRPRAILSAEGEELLVKLLDTLPSPRSKRLGTVSFYSHVPRVERQRRLVTEAARGDRRAPASNCAPPPRRGETGRKEVTMHSCLAAAAACGCAWKMAHSSSMRTGL